MRFPVCLKHLPTLRNHALRPVSHLTRPASVRAHKVCAAHETRRHPPAGKTIELRRSSPHKDTILRTRLLHDLLNNGEKTERLCSHRKGHNKKSYRWEGGRTNNPCSDPSPASLRRTLFFRDKARERVARENRQRRKHCQMIMSRKSPSNKDRQITEAEPQNKQDRLG